MPGKHVRFSRTNVLHSPPTPALSIGSLSPASSYGALTPPYVSHGLPGPSPYALPYPVQPKHARVILHPLLETSSSLDFDMINHPSTIYHHHHSIPSRTLAEPATNPPMPTLSLTSPHLPWTLRAHASNGTYVTLADVFEAIYRSLRMNITPSEFELFPSAHDRRRATRAYEQRYSRHRSSRTRDEEKRQGMKRIDFLMGLTHFTGLSPTSRGPDNWQLNFK